MGDKSKIEWCDATWNPVTGCTKISQGCKNCYAEGVANRFWGDRKFTDVQCHEDRLDQPLRWKRPRRIFVNSMSDLFHLDVPDEFIDKVFGVMVLAKQHTFMILTKRPERMHEVIWRLFPTAYLKNVWLGVSVENQDTADERIPLLLRTPAAVRFVSCEPLLGPVDLSPWIKPRSFDDLIQLDKWNRKAADESKEVFGLNERTIAVDGKPYKGRFLDPEKLDWVIVGGESGPHARPMHPDWVRSIRDQCVDAGTSFFFKQWGEFIPNVFGDKSIPENTNFEKPHELIDGGVAMCRVGKKAAGRMLDGKEWDQFPASPPTPLREQRGESVKCEDCVGFGCCEDMDD